MHPGSAIRVRPPLLASILALAALSTTASAQTSGSPTDGIRAGRWILSPYVFAGMDFEDNVFRRSSEAGQEGPESDRIRRTTVGLVATMPFSNSHFDLNYLGNRYTYSKNRFTRDWSHDGLARMTMEFGSGDRLTLGERFVLGVGDVLAIENNELVFQGQAFNLSRWDIGLSRAVPGRQGYSVKVTRADLNWEEPEGDTQIPFFDYRGFDSQFEYRHPLPLDRWLIAYHDSRRYNHYRPRGYQEDGEPAWELGVPFRKEEADSYQVGFRGPVGHFQEVDLRAGWGRFRYSGTEASRSEFRGLVGFMAWGMQVGSRTSLGLGLLRRPLPSNFSTYYIVNELTVSVDRNWLRDSRAGLNLAYSKNRYGEPLEEFCGGLIRKDQRLRAELHAIWTIQRRIGFRVAARRQQQSSNCAGADYDANTLSAGMTLGWY